jgi:hypothetical protein
MENALSLLIIPKPRKLLKKMIKGFPLINDKQKKLFVIQDKELPF